MKNIFAFVLRLLPLVALLLSSTALAAEQKRVLMVVSGNGQGQGETAPGYEFDEFSKAWLVFRQHGLAIDVASPKGGKVEADKYNAGSPYNAKVLADADAMAKLDNTLATATLNAGDYDAVFVVGGKGAMFDLPQDAALQSLIAGIYQQQGLVAAVCHGPAALVDVKLANGSYLIANRAVNSFTNTEEKLFASKWIADFPFMLEDKLVQRGGKFESTDIMLSHVAVDERLITGQNPASTVAVALELVKALAIPVKPVELYKEDLTLGLVARVLEGDSEALQELGNNRDKFDMRLVGTYGYFYLDLAQNSAQMQIALSLMLPAQDIVKNPILDTQIAKAQKKMGDTQAAVKTLEKVLADNPDFAPAQKMLSSLSL